MFQCIFLYYSNITLYTYFEMCHQNSYFPTNITHVKVSVLYIMFSHLNTKPIIIKLFTHFVRGIGYFCPEGMRVLGMGKISLS